MSARAPTRKRSQGNRAARQPHVEGPAGRVEAVRLISATLRNERQLWVYTPPGYPAVAAPHDLLLLFDGAAYLQQIAAPRILDNLITAGQIGPMVAVLIDCVDGPTRDVELACHAPFVEFLAGELLPWVRGRYLAGADLARVVVGGASYGGLAAAFAAYTRPDLFGNVLAQSGSFWWRPAEEREYEWLARQFVESPRLPLRFYLEVGRREASARVRPNQLIATRHMRDVLRARGYSVHYTETDGRHEYAAWRATFADALVALLGRAGG